MKKFSKRDLKRQINGDLPLDQKVKNPMSTEATTAEVQTPAKRRLDELVFEKYPEYSHSSLRIAIRNGLVSIENAVESKNKNASTQQIETDPTTLFPKETVVTLNLPEKPTPPPPNIIYEDDNVFVINKPTGLLSIVKGNFCFEPSVADYGTIVHRLDRATSGVMILAKNQIAEKLLRRQFNRRTAHKTYYAIVSGTPKIPKAKIDLPLARDLNHPTTFRVDPHGRPSQTYYEVIATKNGHSLLKLQPITGRTHQLRIHLKHIGCPIVGDTVYGNTKTPSPRLFLHATFLEITIPARKAGAPNERKTFFAPLPPEFTAEFPCEPDSSPIGANH